MVPGLQTRFTDTISGLRLPPFLRLPTTAALDERGRLVTPFDRGIEVGAAAAARARWRDRRLTALYARDDSMVRLLLPDQWTEPAPRTGLFGLGVDKVDLLIDGQLSLEISTERLENLRCTAYDLQDATSGCRPRFRAPRIDNLLNLQARGVIGQRVHVDVDLDTSRDYLNNNTIRIYYEGLEDEVLREVNVGTVQFRPPPSRFLTAGIPTNNFGVSAVAEYGPLTVQGLFATQKGSVVAERTYRIGDETVQPQDRLVRDLDYENGRFFWAVNPRLLPGYPDIDPLDLQGLQPPPELRPIQVRVYRYRAATGSQGTNPNLGGLSALGINQEGAVEQIAGPLRWEILIQGRDYWLDPSGLWFVLTSKLDPGDHLAVSYVTESGFRAGTFPAVDNPAVRDTVILVVDPNRGPEAGTFARAMRNIYRVAGSDLTPGSLAVSVLLNQSERPAGGISTWLSLFDLARPSDQAVFDADNHLFPRVRDPGAAETIRDFFIVFPRLQPFADAQRIPDPAQRNDSLYRTPEYLLFTEGPPTKFRLRLQYNARGGGDRSRLSLDAQEIRAETEQIFVEGRRLQRGLDYSIAYASGEVTFLNPEELFGPRGGNVTVRFEERGFFAVAPTSIFGLTARYALGDMGGISLVGLYQSEATAFNRPPLGFEPTASLIGGISGDLRIDVPSVTRFLDRLVPGSVSARSTLLLEAELAFSRPTPNRTGEAFLEEFENDQGIIISMRENAWQFGSLPQSAAGVESFGFATGFDSTDAVQLVWQNLIPNASRTGALELRATDIDTNIVIQGGTTVGTETAMFLTFHADTAGGVVGRDNRSRWSQPRRDQEPRWRSMVTPLSLTGVDLSRNEYLEFWVFENFARPIGTNNLKVMIDLGNVSEDALALAPESFTVTGFDTVYSGRQYVGVGALDTERSPTGTFNASTDDIGIHGDRPEMIGPDGTPVVVPLCRRTLSNEVEVYPWGDLSGRCTAGNGLLDTEDLDGDLLLNARGENEDVFRYVVDLTDPRYKVRTGVITVDPQDPERVSGWTLYRVPLREPDREIGQPNIRLVRHLRFTLLTPPDNGQPDEPVRFAMARMRLTGAPWISRAATPILGLSGSLGEPRGEVIATTISTENVELGYTSPPGLGNNINEVGSGSEGVGVQVNEKALRIIARDIRPGERAEAYNRFVGGSQNLLAYRELRVWARGRGEGWEDERLRAFVKVGTDDDNFYYYEATANTVSWLPDVVVDLNTWRDLRAEVELSFLQGDPPNGAELCGGDPEAYVACRDGHVVHLRDPAINPPNLAAVQEVAAGFRYQGEGAPISETEVWIDDVRLGSPITEMGIATAISAQLTAGDIGFMSLAYVSQDGQFRQIGQAPSYRSTRTFTGSTTLQLGRFLPTGVGVAAPVTVSHLRSAVNPDLISGSDVRGSQLANLRRPAANVTTVSLVARRTLSDGGFLVRTLVNPLSFQGQLSSSAANTEYSQSTGRSWNATLGWDKQFVTRERSLGLGALVSRLPRWLRESEMGEGIAEGGWRLLPTYLRLTTSLSRASGENLAFQVPIRRLSDTILIPTTNLQHLWSNTANTSWQPLGMLVVAGSWGSTRDLRVYPDSTPIGRLTGQSRRAFLGLDAGIERDRQVSTTISLLPKVASWLRPRATTASSFILSRSLTTRNPVQVEGDTAGAYILPQTLNNARTNELGVTIDPATLLTRLLGDTSSIGQYFNRVRSIDASVSRTIQSTYDLAAFDPGTSYQLALGSFDSFLEQEGELAIGANETNSASVSGGLDLPLGLSGTVSYMSTTNNRYQRNSNDEFIRAETVQRDWPDFNVRWSRTLRGPLSYIELSTRLREREASSLIPSSLPDQDPAIISQQTSTFEPSGRLTFRNGLSIRGQASVERGTGLNNGNLTLRQGDRISGSIEWGFRLPRWASPLRKRLSTSIQGSTLTQIDCLQTDLEDECEPISDFRRMDLSGTVETEVVSDVKGGFTVRYSLLDLRHIDRKTATINLSLTLSVPLSTIGRN
jgi:hypothetical protein